MPMTAKAQRMAGKRYRLMRGLFQVSSCSAEAVVGDGKLSFRSCVFSPSSRLRPASVVMGLGETIGLSLSIAGCNSIGSSMTTVEDPPLRCWTLMVFVPIPASGIFSRFSILQAEMVEEGMRKTDKDGDLRNTDSHVAKQARTSRIKKDSQHRSITEKRRGNPKTAGGSQSRYKQEHTACLAMMFFQVRLDGLPKRGEYRRQARRNSRKWALSIPFPVLRGE